MPMTLTVTPVTQGVGYASIFTITGGPPNAAIAWSSTKNGVPTGEDHAQYSGQVTDANGNWSASGGNWPASMVGEWEKIAYVYPPDGSAPWTAKADFAVVAGGGSTVTTGGSGGASQGSSGGFLDGVTNIPGFGAVSNKNLLIVGGVLAAVFLLPSSGGRR